MGPSSRGLLLLRLADLVERDADILAELESMDNGKSVSDARAIDVAGVAGAITPVPGGVGPMTITMLMANTLRSARLSAGLEG